jgi:hypothetical protein
MRMPPRTIRMTLRIMLNLELPFCTSAFQRLAELRVQLPCIDAAA